MCSIIFFLHIMLRRRYEEIKIRVQSQAYRDVLILNTWSNSHQVYVTGSFSRANHFDFFETNTKMSYMLLSYKGGESVAACCVLLQTNLVANWEPTTDCTRVRQYNTVLHINKSCRYARFPPRMEMLYQH